MLINLDWISFSVSTGKAESGDDREAGYLAYEALRNLHDDLPEHIGLTAGVESGKGRAPYSVGWRNAAAGVILFTHPNLTHALVEIQGHGCNVLREEGFLRDVCEAVQQRVTRIDISCDILTECKPTEFERMREAGRFTARSEIVSDTGETVYVGARSSDRYARVYRYEAPHERHKLLRVEYVVKGDNAKIALATILSTSIESVARSLGDTFGWMHPLWQVDAEAVELAVYRPDRREGKTLFWLADTIAPLLARLHNERVIDVTQWIDNYVFPKIR